VRDPRTDDQRRNGARVLLRFGAVDYDARVWVAGREVGRHRGGATGFSVDATEALDAAGTEAKEGEGVRVTLRVFDSAHDLEQPRGKQYWAARPVNIFYTPSGGIWQSVWMEVVPPVRIAEEEDGTVLRATDLEAGVLSARVVVDGKKVSAGYTVDVEVALADVKVGRTERDVPADKMDVEIELGLGLDEKKLEQLPADFRSTKPLSDDSAWKMTGSGAVALWSPEHPALYEITIRLLDSSTGSVVDTIETTTGARSITWRDGSGALKLNGKPYFHALVLDQGYWPSTAMTPPTPGALKTDIELAKKMGFNGCRKHQKTEDPLFSYWADRLGFMVWGEISNAYAFGTSYVERFDDEWKSVVKRERNRPSVVAWTPVNESWAYTDLEGSVEQRDHIRSLYWQTR
jgi:beta-galactosidase/beta-glucuronidase